MYTSVIHKTGITLCFSILITAIFTSCNKSDNSAIPTNPIIKDPIPNCDVVGYSYVGYNYTAKYWKNGVETKLFNGANSKAIGISVDKNDVFIAGQYSDPNSYYSLPKLWKNGVEVPMNVVYPGAGVERDCRGYARSITTHNGNSYVAGYVTDGGGSFSIATLWVNGGTPLLLNPRLDQDLNNSDSYAEAVYVTDNGDIYVAGEQFIGNGLGNKQIVMWKNGVKTQITNYTADVNGFPGEVISISVSGTDVFICCRYAPEVNGKIVSRVIYFKNGNLIFVSDPDVSYQPTSMYVVKNDVYISGNTFNSSDAFIWKNNEKTKMSTIKYGSRINKVFIKNNEIYGCGDSDLKLKAVVWKNNKIYPLTDGTESNIALDIFVR